MHVETPSTPHALFLFAHCDDDLFILPHLLRLKQAGYTIWCAYLTTPPAALELIREQESLDHLSGKGIPPSNIFFIGKTCRAMDGQLHMYVEAVIHALIEHPQLPRAIDEVYCPLWEGGHQDHDICFLIAQHLCRHQMLGHAALFSFPLYQGESLPGRLFRTQTAPSRFQSSTIIHPLKYREALTVIKGMFSYRSQWKTFMGLGPQMAWPLFIRRTYQLVEIDPARPVGGRPHEGRLLYERYNRANYEQISRIESFLSGDRI